jgi:4-hydroxybutyryl-CoA dehydratase/vinylacetyl-CoA-Delta-isomerase
MGLKTVQEYKDSLKDERVVYYKGERVTDVTTHPDLSVAADTMALDYHLAELPEFHDLATVYDEVLGERINRYYYLPKDGQDLLKQFELIVASTRMGDGFIPLAHDIGSDALNAISITANAMENPEYVQRIENYRTHLKKTDLAVVTAMTDVKGNRMLRPSDPQQAHPDYYLRVVNKGPAGITVRGAKMHITGAAYSNEIFAIPSRAMSEADADYAVAFAIPVATKGLRMVCRPFPAHISSLDFPIRRPVRVHTDALIIFDDVFVPWERVFLCGEWKHSATLVYNFALMHRRTGCAYRIPMSEQFLGVAKAIADYNGIANAPHVREELTDLVIYLETLRSMSRAACLDFVSYGGIAVPNPISTNIAKYYFASEYHHVIKIIEDLAGGALVTAPSFKDYQVAELHDDIKKYLGASKGYPAEQRLRMLDLIRRISGADRETIALHGEGSLQAQRMTILAEARQVIGQCLQMVEQQAEIK